MPPLTTDRQFIEINGDQAALQKQVKAISQRNEDSEYLVKAKLQEKDEQIQCLIKRQEQFEHLIQSLIDSGQFKSHKI
jgi:hypothetical protein